MSAPKTMLGGEDVHAIVIDCGSWVMRIGSAGDDSPRSVIPSAVGIKSTSSSQNSVGADATMADVTTGTTTGPSGASAQSSTTIVAGDSVVISPHLFQDVSPAYSIDSTTGDATVQNWDAVEAIWRVGLKTLHMEQAVRSAPLMIVEPSRMWSDSERARALQCAFEGLQVPAAYIGRGAAMAAFSAARPTSCVLDIGAQGATAVPVIEGYVLKKTSRKSAIGGTELSSKLKEWAESCLEHRPEYDGRERSPGKRARNEAYLRAHHELRRQRIIDSVDDDDANAEATVNGNGGDGKPVKRRYKVTDISDSVRYTDAHRLFYRLRLIDDLKASLFHVDSSKPADDDGNAKSNEPTAGNTKKSGEGSDDKEEKDGSASNTNNTNNTNSNNQPNKDKTKEQKQSSGSESNSSTYTLPDGNELSLAERDGNAIGDLLFTSRPDSNICSMTDLVLNSIGATDVDNRRELFGGVVVVGGSSLIPGCVERLARELALKIPQAYKLKLHAALNTTERTCAGWIGGSIVASLGTFQQAWISKAEYDEHGANGALRKCP